MTSPERLAEAAWENCMHSILDGNTCRECVLAIIRRALAERDAEWAGAVWMAYERAVPDPAPLRALLAAATKREKQDG